MRGYTKPMRPCDEAKAVQRMPRSSRDAGNSHGVSIDGQRGACFVSPLDIVLSEYNVVQPDVVYFGPETVARLDPLEYVRVPPDAAFEVLSPSTARNDRGRKRTLMERFGVREYWVIDPRGRSL